MSAIKWFLLYIPIPMFLLVMGVYVMIKGFSPISKPLFLLACLLQIASGLFHLFK